MKRYQDFLVLERTPYMKKPGEPKLQQFRGLNVPAEGWRTTTDYGPAGQRLVSLNRGSKPPFVRPDPLLQSVTH